MPKKNRIDDSLIEEAGTGHNSFSKTDLMAIIENVEALIAERANTSEDIRAAMEVADQKGFDKRTIREMIKLRALGLETRKEREDLRDMYLNAMGLID